MAYLFPKSQWVLVEDSHNHLFFEDTRFDLKTYWCTNCFVCAFSDLEDNKLYYDPILLYSRYNSWFCEDIQNERLIRNIIE